MNASIFFKSRRRPIHLDFLRWKLRPGNIPSALFFSGLLGERVGNCSSAAWNLRRNKAFENWPSGNSIVLRTRRSTLALVYV
jgi:hypothetical protein